MQHDFNRSESFLQLFLLQKVGLNFRLFTRSFIHSIFFIGTYVSFSLFGTIYILPRNTNEMCMSIVQQRSPPVFDSHVRNTLDRIRPLRSMCHCIDGHSSLECLTGDFSYKIRVTVPNTPDLWCRAICDRDCTASIGSDIYVEEKSWQTKIYQYYYCNFPTLLFCFYNWI